SFAAVEAARGDVPLTYFEYGTLAGLWFLKREGIEAAVLEVGLGGRLDAVNVVDADCAVLTSIGIDHVDYLGPDRESIGREKAAAALADNLAASGYAPETFAVCGMLRDKDIGAVLQILAPRITRWHLASLAGPRAASARALSQYVKGDCFDSPSAAFAAALER